MMVVVLLLMKKKMMMHQQLWGPLGCADEAQRACSWGNPKLEKEAWSTLVTLDVSLHQEFWVSKQWLDGLWKWWVRSSNTDIGAAETRLHVRLVRPSRVDLLSLFVVYSMKTANKSESKHFAMNLSSIPTKGSCWVRSLSSCLLPAVLLVEIEKDDKQSLCPMVRFPNNDTL